MKTTDKILEFITSKEGFVSLKDIQDGLEMKPNAIAGFLAHLCKTGKLVREKQERTNGNGPKMQWFYKVVANSQQND